MLSSKYEDLLINNFLKLSLQNKYSNVYSKFNPFVNIVGGVIHHPTNRNDVDRMLNLIAAPPSQLGYRRGALDETDVPRDFYIYLDLGNGIAVDWPKYHFHIFEENGEWVFQLTARCNDEQIDNIPNCNDYMNNKVNPGWNIETRIDPRDDRAHTKEDFVQVYGGTAEWDAAASSRNFVATRHKLSGCHFNENIRYAWSHKPAFVYGSAERPTNQGDDLNFLRSLNSGKLADSNFALEQRALKRYAPRLFKDFDIPSYTNETSYLNAIREKMEKELLYVESHCRESCNNTDCNGNKRLLTNFITYLKNEGIDEDNITKQINIYSRLFSLENFKNAYDEINVDTYMHDAASQEIVLNLLKKVFITLTNIMSGDNNKYDTKIDSDNYIRSYDKYKYIFQYLGFKDTLYAACIAHIILHFLNHIKDEGTDETKKKELNEAYKNLKNLIENYIDPEAKLLGVAPVAQEYKRNPFNIKLNPKFQIGQQVDYKDQVFIVMDYNFLTRKYTVRNVVPPAAGGTAAADDEVNESNLEAHIQPGADLHFWEQHILYNRVNFVENYTRLLDFIMTDLETPMRNVFTSFKAADLNFLDEPTLMTNKVTLIHILDLLVNSRYYVVKYKPKPKFKQTATKILRLHKEGLI